MSSGSDSPIPVALFAYARPDHLRRVLASLRQNEVRLIYAFADGAKPGRPSLLVAEVRETLRQIDWCDLRLVQRPQNLGLGCNVRAGVGEVLSRHEQCIVWEDDLIAVPGTYAWLCAALNAYAEDSRVMSVTAWTHPRVTPSDIDDAPYFDARAECWGWGTWARAWAGMEDGDALAKMAAAQKRGIAPDAYGSDLPQQARLEHTKNTWAVRWLYHHLALGGLCLRPPWSMVEHIGFGAGATNAIGAYEWQTGLPSRAPRASGPWPVPAEHPACRFAWSAAIPRFTLTARIGRWCKRLWRSA